MDIQGVNINLRIPQAIKVGARVYSVELDNVIEDDGNCSFKRGVIKINPNLARDNQEITFIHEMLHACCEFTGLEEDKKLTEEEFVTRISSILHCVLKENHFLDTNFTASV